MAIFRYQAVRLPKGLFCMTSESQKLHGFFQDIKVRLPVNIDNVHDQVDFQGNGNILLKKD